MNPSDDAPVVTHRCGTTGEGHDVRARYDADSKWYVSECPVCETGCRQYHEPEEITHG